MLICIHSLPSRWGKGHGSRLLEEILRQMRQARYRTAVLWVFEGNIRARKFYEKHGFTAAGQQKNELGSPEMLYQKRL